jgi:hypothetical protein
MFEITPEEQRRLMGMSAGLMRAAGTSGSGKNVSSRRLQADTLLASAH